MRQSAILNGNEADNALCSSEAVETNNNNKRQMVHLV